MADEIKVKVDDAAKETKEGIKLNLKARETLDGNILVCDHKELDIVIDTDDQKIIAFAKNSMDDGVYAAQERLFDFLAKKGVIKRDSVAAGSVYASMEAEYPEAVQEGINTTQMILFSIGKWISEEKPLMQLETYYEEEWLENLTKPDEDESTELGEVPHEEEKGSIDPSRIRRYLTGWGYYILPFLVMPTTYFLM